MKENFKIEKQLLFKNNIKEITSISLDSDFDVENNSLKGNFIVSGEYKIHEVSINKEKFNFKIPFEHGFESDIDKESIKLEISDFIYDYKNDELVVNIEYEIMGDRKDVLLFDNEESLDEFLNKREVEIIDTRINDIKNLTNNKKDEVFTKNDDIIENSTLSEASEINENVELLTDSSERVNADDIMDNVTNIQDKFVTYKVYKIEENDTLEAITLKFHTNIDELKEYNELNNISIGDKIIIPINE